MNHQGDGLETHEWDVHGGEAGAGLGEQVATLLPGLRVGRKRCPSPCAPTEAGELWAGNCFDAFGHKVTMGRSLSYCLVCGEEALVNTVISKASSNLIPHHLSSTLYLARPCPQTQVHFSQQRHTGSTRFKEARGTGHSGD